MLGLAGARPVRDVGLRPAQLLELPARLLRPHPHREVRRAVARGRLLEDHVDREVLEAQRHPAPPHALERRRAALRVGLPHRADAPRAVARRGPSVGRDVDGPAVDAQLTGPGARPARSGRRRAGPVAVAPQVLRLLDGPVVGLELEVETESVVVAVADEAQLGGTARAPRSGRGRPVASSCRRGGRPTCGRTTACRRVERWRRRRSHRGSDTRRAR